VSSSHTTALRSVCLLGSTGRCRGMIGVLMLQLLSRVGKNLGERGRRDENNNQLQKGRSPRRHRHRLRRKRRGEIASSSLLSSSRKDDNVGQREGRRTWLVMSASCRGFPPPKTTDMPTCRRCVADTTQILLATLHRVGLSDAVLVSCRHDNLPTCRQKTTKSTTILCNNR